MSEHGTTTRYRQGCRCEACTDANRVYMRDYMRDYRAKRREPADAEAKGQGGVSERAFGAALICALGRLTEQQRYVFVMSAMHGKSYAQIAERIGLSRERARQIYRDAQERLERDLEPYREEIAA